MLKSHSCIIPGEVLSVIIFNDVTYGGQVPHKQIIKVNSNDTVLQLKIKIGKLFKVTWEEVKIIRIEDQTELIEGDNGRSIGDLRFKNREALNYKKLPIK